MNAVEVKRITKQYGKVCALSDISFALEENKIYGLLGRNGAGKTTLLNIIGNRLFADAGTAMVFGESAQESDAAQEKLFYTTDCKAYPHDSKIRDLFRWTKEFYPTFSMNYAKKLSEKFALGLDKKVRGLSTGYLTVPRNILTLASGAPVLLFDEPVLGLDANLRELFYREVISLYSEKPCTIVISTHLIDEVADILENVLILKEGKLIVNASVEDILKLGYTVSGESAAVDHYTKDRKVLKTENMGKYKAATIYQKKEGNDEEKLCSLGLEVTPARLQELFISLTNEGGKTNE